MDVPPYESVTLCANIPMRTCVRTCAAPQAWARYDSISFRDLCVRLGVSKRLYKEAFEPMILTGLFAPGEECSAAAALGMAYFFVLKHQTSFDVRWARGNVGEVIFAPWVEAMKARNVTFMQSTRVVGFEETADSKIGAKIDAEIDSTSAEIKSTLRPTAQQSSRLSAVLCSPAGAAASDPPTRLEADNVVFAVGAAALSGLVRNSPILSRHAELRRFCNLRGTSVLATRLFLDRPVRTPYSANACWGFDEGVGMTWFDIRQLHKPAHDHEPGAVLEVDYYHSNSLLSMSDSDIVTKAKHDLDQMLGADCVAAEVIDAAVVRLPSGVNWYYPGSYKNMPDTTSTAIPNAYFVGDLVRTRHGSWSQEKAFVTGIEAANAILHRPVESGVIPLKDDETHVAFGRSAVSRVQKLLGLGDRAKGPSIADFLF
uniref:Amine oxidase domain-containing protein n=1 Tax=Chrysotila carterae TaxID=13221 RepID=A0A7S4B4U3_CHRCT